MRWFDDRTPVEPKAGSLSWRRTPGHPVTSWFSDRNPHQQLSLTVVVDLGEPNLAVAQHRSLPAGPPSQRPRLTRSNRRRTTSARPRGRARSAPRTPSTKRRGRSPVGGNQRESACAAILLLRGRFSGAVDSRSRPVGFRPAVDRGSTVGPLVHAVSNGVAPNSGRSGQAYCIWSMIRYVCGGTATRGTCPGVAVHATGPHHHRTPCGPPAPLSGIHRTLPGGRRSSPSTR